MPVKIYKNKFEYVHENIFFRKLAHRLIELYEKRNEFVVLIGNPVIIDEDGNKVAPDALFISKNSFNIIDFKNYSGEITIPETDNFEFENWKHGDVIIKGGNQINPYIQLKKHRDKLGDYLNFHKSNFLSSSSKFHTKFIDCIVCFINDIELIGEVPEKKRNWFFIEDKNSIIPVLEDIISTRINLSDGDIERLAYLFSTTIWNPNELYKESETIEEKSDKKEYYLSPEQERVLNEIKEFLIDDDLNILILSGSYSCGKTFLINQLIKNFPKNTVKGWQVLAPNNRIARNVRKQVESVSSLYSYIYKFSEQIEIPIEEEINKENLDLETDDSELIDTKLLFNIRENNDTENFLYILDEAHHISDACFNSPTLQFGTGQLLADFVSFVKASNTKRKILFLGDKYRLGTGSFEESALCIDYLISKYSLKCKEIEMLPYPPTNTNIIKQASSVRSQIVKNKYNNLNLVNSELVKVTKSDSNLSNAMQKHFSQEPYDTKILAFSNENILKANNWIRTIVLHKRENRSVGDLLVIENNVIVAPDNPFAVPQRVFKGEFAEIISIGTDTHKITQYIKKNKPIQLIYRELKLKLIERNLEVTVLSLENFWNSTEKDISREEYICIQIYINRKVSAIIKEEKLNSTEWLEFTESEQYKILLNEIDKLQEQLKQGQKVKTKFDDSKRKLKKIEREFWRKRRIEIHRDIVYHDKFVNAVHLRYGYAVTVHRAQSYKWNHVFFNLNQGDDRGTDTKGYFKWVYSGIGCAKKRLYLVNVPKITPYTKMVWKDNHACTLNYDKKKEVFPYSEDVPISLREKPTSFESVPDILFSFYCWLSSELELIKVSIDSVEHKDYAEHYNLSGKDGEKAFIIIWYDGKYLFKKHKIVNSNPEDFGGKIDKFLNDLKTGKIDINKTRNIDFSDNIFTELFEKIRSKLLDQNIKVLTVEHQKYAERITFQKDEAFIVLDIFLNSEGFITSLYPIKCNNPNIYDLIKNVFNEFIGKHGKPLTTSE